MKADLCKRHRQADRCAEVEHRGDFFLRSVFKHQLRKGSKGNFFAVMECMHLGRNGEAVVDGVCGCESS